MDFNLDSGIGVDAPAGCSNWQCGTETRIAHQRTNDWRAVEEITTKLREFDAEDPIKYDFALFGLGVFEKF